MQQSHFLKVRNSTVKTSILYFFGDIDFKGLNNTDNITNKKSSHVESFPNYPTIIIYLINKSDLKKKI